MDVVEGCFIYHCFKEKSVYTFYGNQLVIARFMLKKDFKVQIVKEFSFC